MQMLLVETSWPKFQSFNSLFNTEKMQTFRSTSWLFLNQIIQDIIKEILLVTLMK